jgi:hypothetical protein
MSEATWKRIVEDLKEQRLEQRHLDRLASRVDLARGGDGGLEREIIAEMARTLGRVTRRLTDALDRLREVGREIDSAADAATRAGLVAEFNERRAEAARARWELLVQREALGFRRHEDIDACYPLPPCRRS